MNGDPALRSLRGLSVHTLGQLYVIVGSDQGLVGVALHRLPPKRPMRPMVLLCGALAKPKRKQRGQARLSAKQRRLRVAKVAH